MKICAYCFTAWFGRNTCQMGVQTYQFQGNEELRDANTIEVQVTGKPNLFRPKLITSKYLMAMIVKSTVFPDLYDKELQDSYGVMTPEDLVYAMVDDAGEMQDFQLWMQKFQGFTKSLDERLMKQNNYKKGMVKQIMLTMPF